MDDKALIQVLYSALKQARQCVGENHVWHTGYDDSGHYPGSHLYELNRSTIAKLQELLSDK